MAEDAEIKYVANADYVLREVVGELLLIPVGSLMMFSNEVITISEGAAYLWRNMNEEKTETELCDLMRMEYDVDEETARRDIREMLESMCRKNIVFALQDGWIIQV